MLVKLSPAPISGAYTADNGIAVRYSAGGGTFYMLSAFYSSGNNNGNYTVELKRKPDNVPINPNVGFRFDIRGYVTQLGNDSACNVCNYGYNSTFYQGQANLGVFFSF